MSNFTETTRIINTSQKPIVNLDTLLILKRDLCSFKPYDRSKIFKALEKAFLATLNDESLRHSEALLETLNEITNEIEQQIIHYTVQQLPVTVEKIQDFVEKQLMLDGHHEIAKSYILYRENRARARQNQHQGHSQENTPDLILSLFKQLSTGLHAIDLDLLVKETLKSIYIGMPIHELYQAMVMSARSLIETDSEYSTLAARILLSELKKEVYQYLNVDTSAHASDAYGEAFIQAIHKGVALEQLNPHLATYPLAELAKALRPERDAQFDYLGLQTLYDRYFLHDQKTKYELPQVFFMRVAMGLTIEEAEPVKRAIEFYNTLSTFVFMSSTPTLFNSGTTRSQLSSCFLSTVGDDLFNIYGAIRDNAMLSKFAGGLGNDWTPVRGINSYIKGTNGQSQGVIPFLKVANDTAVAVNQGGKRKGALCVYLECWHRDIEEFLELRKNTGDERRRTHDINTALWIPDLFMERMRDDSTWTLFSPDETPELHDTYGREFEKLYVQYEEMAKKGKIKNAKEMSAKQLWRKMLAMIFETGHPWITFKDPCNLRSPQQHVGVVHSSNLCTEITLNTSADEIAVCNLGSINLAAHIQNGVLNSEKLRATVRMAIRMLDNVIDINYYSVESARRSNMRHRPIGLGIMGFQDALYELGIPYDSATAIEFADRSMEEVSYYAIEASADLAIERGAYQTFDGSLWSKGILPIDSLSILHANRRENECQVNVDQTLNWALLRDKVKKGMRNSNVLAIAPTATIANICGVSQSIEPTYQNLYVKSNLSGEFTVINPYLVKKLKKHGLFDKAMIHDLKYYDGQLSKIHRIPAELRELFKTAFEIPPQSLIAAASRRAKWIDQSQSLNLYFDKPSGRLLDQTYQTAWLYGLKTTYYGRTLGATDSEKSTINDGKLNAVAVTSVKACSIDDPTCESCQ